MVHGTTSDPARWYITASLSPSHTDLTFLQPKNSTISAFGRASTLSLGSIAFGSLIVTLLDLLKMILQAARNNANADGHRECMTFCLSGA